MGLLRSKKLSAKLTVNVESPDARSSAKSLKSRLYSCFPIKSRRCKAGARLPPQQHEGANDPLKSKAQSKGFDRSCLNPLYTEDCVLEDEQHHGHLSQVPERLQSQVPDQTMLTPEPLQNRAERFHEAEQAVSEHAQQVQNSKMPNTNTDAVVLQHDA